ncbi:hypothetical protein IPA_02145 [Ignicoccus pacificus DSM 13166]|uniref:Uncharacterized protein n=1 Tax=Ignicoccus pacificus DSM 13166 TaxID=940294 RepID=A0A977KBP1_9CREN|nr:hypothetical protein IPA_02145 [Ignicoccus pacificus DSM 13166]
MRGARDWELGSRRLLIGIFALALAYGGYTTLARVSSGSPEAASAIAFAEMLSSAPGVLAGWLGDRKGLKAPALIGVLSLFTSLVKTQPLHGVPHPLLLLLSIPLGDARGLQGGRGSVGKGS